MQGGEDLLSQAVARKRCASCQIWSGLRQPGSTPDVVLIEVESSTGICQGGPWDGSERRARSACGHWQCWSVLSPTANEAVPG
ncbi:hypothetical protein LZ012_10210 [Dechloromonas sp. XY25]|uniref:Uncharacterized protein n=1 Tax=Dechloromonas hankyongensis TaxID=2908002 RepID=A0ABS9K2H8_9RHOO|nr:hypothetical protein [Dechloromonas hankyongensis]MCG2577367.1 hypothetical protein [Dechloromonas hankyongensis]